MVATTELKRRLDLHLRAAEAALTDLDELAPCWADLSEFDRADFSLEWDHAIADKYAELCEAFDQGQLTADQRTRLRVAARRLTAMRSVSDALGLMPPASMSVSQ